MYDHFVPLPYSGIKTVTVTNTAKILAYIEDVYMLVVSTTRIRSVERGICPIAAVCAVLFYCPDQIMLRTLNLAGTFTGAHPNKSPLKIWEKRDEDERSVNMGPGERHAGCNKNVMGYP